MKAHIFTPEGPVFEGEVTGVQMPGTDGSFEVRKNHAKLVSTLDIGKITVKTPEKGTFIYAISGGFAEVNDNVVTVMAENAVDRNQIDLQGELQRMKDIEKALKSLKVDTVEHSRMDAELRKTANRIHLFKSDNA